MALIAVVFAFKPARGAIVYDEMAACGVTVTGGRIVRNGVQQLHGYGSLEQLEAVKAKLGKHRYSWIESIQDETAR